MEYSQDLILLFRIPIGTGKDFFEIFTQFRQAPSKRFAVEARLAPDPVWTSWEERSLLP